MCREEKGEGMGMLRKEGKIKKRGAGVEKGNGDAKKERRRYREIKWR